MNFLSDQVKKFSDSKPEEPDHNKPVEGTEAANVKKLSDSKPDEPDNTKPVEGTETANRPASPSELMTSSKVVAEAAQAAARNESDKLDKAKVAGDSADILDVDQEYGRFDKSDAGQYFEKAEKYLKEFESSGAVVTPYTPDIGAPPPSASR
ncbi:unnamed protein product [Brassica napus]|uniref:(rape) hypothetical protein n=1 Tax=Brassica napus TaxID=3708 RepID=A0A817AG68_BRANA|nr:unnamed protein product [Brassica napus]